DRAVAAGREKPRRGRTPVYRRRSGRAVCHAPYALGPCRQRPAGREPHKHQGERRRVMTSFRHFTSPCRLQSALTISSDEPDFSVALKREVSVADYYKRGAQERK